MITPNTPYRMGPRALIYLVGRKLKYPLMLIVLMIGISVLLYLGKDTLLAWQSGHSAVLKIVVNTLYALQKYGWVLSVLLTISFGLIAVPEYLGLSVTLGDNALLVKRGLLSSYEISIPYRQIETIEVRQNSASSLLGLSALYVRTDNTTEPTLDVVSNAFAEELRDTVLARLTTAN